MKDKIIIHEIPEPEGYGAFDDHEESEEQICSKCLEITEECECEFYDKLEEVELAKERTEQAMSRLKPIKIEVRRMKVIN